MLYSEGSSSASAKQWVAIVVAHELAHQVILEAFAVAMISAVADDAQEEPLPANRKHLPQIRIINHNEPLFLN